MPRSPTPSLAPPRLAPGARVALVCPAGPLHSPLELARAEESARSFGWEPVPGEHVLARDGYLAGSDAERAADLDRALRDPRIDGVWCVRGGYGAMRLLDALDWDALARRPRALLGYSDITALHAAIRARCDLISFHAPTARSTLTPFTRRSLERAVIHGEDPCGAAPDARVLRGGRAVGRLEGGNLALITALVGTPYAARLDDAILVLEDVSEPVYRIDRMLRHLMLSGALARVRAIVFGAFTDRGEETEGTRPLDDVLREAADAAGVPCIAGAPVGHIDDQWTLPLGALAELDADRRTLTVLVERAAQHPERT
ncbi:MAG TPA: LD-carboxypeptidase [Gemmatimonadaceae bacterium]|nr:LD-carboxypeptidase [Gemmatimonadaceae bacterium]